MGTFILDQTNTKAPGATMDDLDENLFEAQEAKIVTVKPRFNFDSDIIDPSKLEWFVDGTRVESASEAPFPYITPATGDLNIPINKSVGEKYAISLKALYTQPDPQRRALHYIWNVPTSAFYETVVSDSAEIQVVKAPTQAASGTKKILASLFSLMPSYLNFLFRIILTMALILISSGLLFSIFPKQNRF